MSFQSLHFFVLLTAVILLNHRLAGHAGLRKNMLLFASYYFYLCWDWRFAMLLIFVTLVNFVAGAGIATARHPGGRRLWMGVAVAGSLGVLAYFKYANFFIESIAGFARSLGFEADLPLLQVVLPIGISFFTFQSLTYPLDIYRGTQQPTRSLRDFALFVAFFPTLLSGPITRANHFLPQLTRPFVPRDDAYREGFLLMVRGFVKKVAFADVLAVHLVNPAFAAPSEYSTLFLVLAVYAYSFQIYMDLSGYTDIVRGAAKMLGFDLIENFDRPYLASSVSNFWQRWHISMSGFFRDYLYYGVGGSRHGNVYLNLYITFLAIGFWHGAGWNFLLYGFLHGSLVAFERWLRTARTARGVVPLPLARPVWTQGLLIVAVFHFVAFSRVLFRAPDLEQAGQYLLQILVSPVGVAGLPALGLAALGAAALLHLLPRDAYVSCGQRFMRLPAPAQAAVLAGIFYGLVALSPGAAGFIYFQF
jgi:alginate O-acetyltransferase complex protein AlgI